MRTHGPRAVENRAKDSLRSLANAGVSVHERVRQHLDGLLARVGNERSKSRVAALVASAWAADE
jgi:hypothetical protein